MAGGQTDNKDNSGALFKNDKKSKETDPEYNGQCRVGGDEYWINAWVNEKNGRKYFRFSFRAKEGQKSNTKQQDAFDDNDIPF